MAVGPWGRTETRQDRNSVNLFPWVNLGKYYSMVILGLLRIIL